MRSRSYTGSPFRLWLKLSEYDLGCAGTHAPDADGVNPSLSYCAEVCQVSEGTLWTSTHHALPLPLDGRRMVRGHLLRLLNLHHGPSVARISAPIRVARVFDDEQRRASERAHDGWKDARP